MKVLVDPHYDTDNSNPPAVEFEENRHTITIRLLLPEREVQIEKEDMRRVLALFVPQEES